MGTRAQSDAPRSGAPLAELGDPPPRVSDRQLAINYQPIVRRALGLTFYGLRWRGCRSCVMPRWVDAPIGLRSRLACYVAASFDGRQERWIIPVARVAGHVLRARPAIRQQHRIPIAVGCSPPSFETRWTRSLFGQRRSRSSTARTGALINTPNHLGCSLASISGVAASPSPGHPPRGSKRLIVRLLDRLSDLGSGPADPPDERLRHGTLIFASC